MNDSGMHPHASDRAELVMRHASWVVPLAVYCVAAFPDVGFWDTGEMAVIPYIFGIAHPPGFPLYVALGWLWTHLFDFGNVAWRMAIFSGASTALACRCLYTVAKFYTAPAIALGATLVFAFAEVTLTRGTRAEIHTLALLFSAFAMVIAERACRGDKRAFFFLPLLFALGICVHPVVLWTIPGAALLAVAQFRQYSVSERAGFLRRLEWGSAAGAAAFLAVYALIPLRSTILSNLRLDPTLALGFPPGMPYFDYAHPSTLGNFLWFIQGKQFGAQGALAAWTKLAQYPHYADFYGSFFYKQFPVMPALGIVTVTVLAGFYEIFRRRRIAGAAYVLAVFGGVPFAAAYAIEIDAERYLLFSLWAAVVVFAAGATLIEGLLKRFVRTPHFTRLSAAVACIVAICAVSQLAANAHIRAQRKNYEGRTFVDNVIAATPDNAIIVAEWTYATPLAYAAIVEERFGKRVVVTAQARDIADRFNSLAAQRPLYLVDGDITGFSDARFTVTPVNAEFPRIVHLVPHSDFSATRHPAINERESAH